MLAGRTGRHRPAHASSAHEMGTSHDWHMLWRGPRDGCGAATDDIGGHMTGAVKATASEETGSGSATDLTLGVEEELHVVDLSTRELVPRAPEVLDRLDDAHFSAELHRSVVETNTPVSATLDELRHGIVRLRRSAIGVA